MDIQQANHSQNDDKVQGNAEQNSPHQENINSSSFQVQDINITPILIQEGQQKTEQIYENSNNQNIVPSENNHLSLKEGSGINILINGALKVSNDAIHEDLTEFHKKFSSNTQDISLDESLGRNSSENAEEDQFTPNQLKMPKLSGSFLSPDTNSISEDTPGSSQASGQLLTVMSKQFTKRDTKNWLSGRNFAGGIRNSFQDHKTLNSCDHIATPKTQISNKTDSDQEEGGNQVHNSNHIQKHVKYGESFCSPARNSQNKKKIIKISNSISTEPKLLNFRDDEPIEFDQSAFMGIVKNYDISKNISLSIKSIQSNPSQINFEHKSTVTLPVLVSIKTADQIMSFTSLKDEEQDSSTIGEEQQQKCLNEDRNEMGEESKEENDHNEFLKEMKLRKDEDKDLPEEVEFETDSYEEDEVNGKEPQDQKQESIKINKDQLGDESQRESVTNENEEQFEEVDDRLRLSSPFPISEQNQISEKFKESVLGKHISAPPQYIEQQLNEIECKRQMEDSTQFNAKSAATSSRFPIDLICVIDTSGSMNGEPLSLVKETLLFLVDLLQKGDRICLIQFSTNAKRLTPLLSISKKGNRDVMRDEIERLVAKGGTNINQGMSVAFEVLKQRKYKNAITSVFLLSDGLNDGAEQRIKDILKSMNFYQNFSEESFTIQTFGFGKDHDPDMMDKISQLMDGNFYYIGDIHRVDECFIDALGGLFSVVSQNVDITLRVPDKFQDKVKIIKTYGDIWRTIQEFYSYSININQLISGVSKDYVLEIEIDSSTLQQLLGYSSIAEEDAQQQVTKENQDFGGVLEVELKAKTIRFKPSNQTSQENQIAEFTAENLIQQQQVSEEQQPSETLVKAESLHLQECNQNNENEVNLHYLRVKGAETLEKCQIYALQKKFDEGSECILNLLHQLQSQPNETKDQLSKLIMDLQEAEEALRKKISEQVGWHRMISCKRMHMEQRSAGIDLTYQNSVQKFLVQKRKIFKDQGIQMNGGGITNKLSLPIDTPQQKNQFLQVPTTN